MALPPREDADMKEDTKRMEKLEEELETSQNSIGSVAEQAPAELVSRATSSPILLFAYEPHVLDFLHSSPLSHTQITLYATIGEQRRSEVAAQFVLEGEGRANEGCTVLSGVLNQMYTDFDPTLFDALFEIFLVETR